MKLKTTVVKTWKNISAKLFLMALFFVSLIVDPNVKKLKTNESPGYVKRDSTFVFTNCFTLSGFESYFTRIFFN